MSTMNFDPPSAPPEYPDLPPGYDDFIDEDDDAE